MVVASTTCLLMASCGGGSHRSSSATTSTSSSTAAPASTTTSSSTSSTTTVPATTTTATPTRCTSADAKVTFAVQSPAPSQPPGKVRALVTFTNSSPTTCIVGGYAGIGARLVGSGLNSIAATRMKVPGPPEAVTLAPGASAYAGAEWTSQSSCSAVSSFELTPPNSTSSDSVKVVIPNGTAAPLHLCPDGIDLGPFEPAATGVLAFPSSTGTGGPAVCAPSELAGSFKPVFGTQGAGSVTGRIVLTNTTRQPCLVGGYLGLQLVGAGGSLLPTNVLHAAGTAKSITLDPGSAASAAARFSPDIAGPGDSKTGPCQPTSTSTRVTLPNESGYLVVSGPDTPVCERGTLDLTPLQPGSTAGAP